MSCCGRAWPFPSSNHSPNPTGAHQTQLNYLRPCRLRSPKPTSPSPHYPPSYITALISSKTYDRRFAAQAFNFAKSDRGNPCRPIERNVALRSSSPALRNHTKFLVDRAPPILRAPRREFKCHPDRGPAWILGADLSPHKVFSSSLTMPSQAFREIPSALMSPRYLIPSSVIHSILHQPHRPLPSRCLTSHFGPTYAAYFSALPSSSEEARRAHLSASLHHRLPPQQRPVSTSSQH